MSTLEKLLFYYKKCRNNPSNPYMISFVQYGFTQIAKQNIRKILLIFLKVWRDSVYYNLLQVHCLLILTIKKNWRR